MLGLWTRSSVKMRTAEREKECFDGSRNSHGRARMKGHSQKRRLWEKRSVFQGPFNYCGLCGAAQRPPLASELDETARAWVRW